MATISDSETLGNFWGRAPRNRCKTCLCAFRRDMNLCGQASFTPPRVHARNARNRLECGADEPGVFTLPRLNFKLNRHAWQPYLPGTATGLAFAPAALTIARARQSVGSTKPSR